MKSDKSAHDEQHQRIIRDLVEGRLAGEDKRQAESHLLSCEACLEEYNWYGPVWESLTDPEGFHRWAAHLSEKDPERYKLYSKVVERVSEYQAKTTAHLPQAESKYWFSVQLWRNLAFALSAIVLLALLIAAYKVVTLQKLIKSQQTYYQALLDEKKDQSARASALAEQAQKQAEKIDELSQALEKYVQPSANAVLSMQFFTTRQPQAHEIAFPKEKLFLNLHIRAAEDKEYKIYSVVIKERLGKTLWQDDRVVKDEEGNFDLLIEKSFLKPGAYVLEIYGLARGQRNLISQIQFHIKTD